VIPVNIGAALSAPHPLVNFEPVDAERPGVAGAPAAMSTALPR